MGGLRYANVETEIYLLTTQELDLTGGRGAVGAPGAGDHRRCSPSPPGYAAHAAPVDRTTRRVPRPRRAHVPVLAWTAAVVVFLMAPLASLVLASLRRGEQLGAGRTTAR